MVTDSINAIRSLQLVHENGVQPVILILEGDILIVGGRAVVEVATLSYLGSNACGNRAVKPHREFGVVFQSRKQLQVGLHCEGF
jgi:hypothetical protein